MSKHSAFSLEDILDPDLIVGKLFVLYHPGWGRNSWPLGSMGLVTDVYYRRRSRRGDEIMVTVLVDGVTRHFPYQTFFDHWNYY